MRILNAVIMGAAALAIAAPASAIQFQTEFQYSTDGTGDGLTNGVTNPGYDLVGLSELDWLSSTGNLLIENALVANSTGATTLDEFFTYGGARGAVVGSTLTFNIHAQTVLGQFLTNSGGAGNGREILDTNGTTNGDQGYEVTMALDAVESAQVIFAAPGNLYGILFTGIDGTLKLFHDTSPDAAPGPGAGFIDGVNFLTADLDYSSGTFFNFNLSNGPTIGGHVSSYDSRYIQADPTALAPLLGTELITTIQLHGAQATPLGVPGGTIGLAPYTAVAGDKIFQADANQPFSAVPEPGTMVLLGSGLLGLAGFGRRRMKK